MAPDGGGSAPVLLGLLGTALFVGGSGFAAADAIARRLHEAARMADDRVPAAAFAPDGEDAAGDPVAPRTAIRRPGFWKQAA